MPTYGEKISQIQIGGLQPCDDLTWNDPSVFIQVRCYCNKLAKSPLCMQVISSGT